MISVILFDLVGTLIEESAPALSTDNGYYGIQVKAIHDSLEKDGLSVEWSSFRKRYEMIRIKQKERSERTLREYDMCKRVADTLRFFRYNIPPTSEIIGRAVDAYMRPYINSLKINQSTYGVLGTLAAGYELGVVTNFAYSSGAYQALDRFALRPFFKAVVVSGEIGWKKPSERIFAVALRRLSIPPEKAIFVGDDYEADIVGAKRMGLKAVLVSRAEDEVVCFDARPDLVVSNLQELMGHLDELI